MLIQHKTTCPSCSGVLTITLEATKPDVQRVGTVVCDGCKEHVAIEYRITAKVEAVVGRIAWDRPAANAAAPAAADGGAGS